MANYRAEVLITHRQEDFEDRLEEIITEMLRRVDIGITSGPVVFRVYPNGESCRWSQT